MRDDVEVLVEEFFERRRSGDRSDVEEMASRVPGREAEFKQLVETLIVLESAAAEPAATEPSAAKSRRRWDAQTRLGRFRLVRLVGRGGMGAVFEAVDEELSRRVALKVLPGHATLDAREIARFHREAHAAARLQHPHIVPVFGVGEDDGAHWLAMQLVQGESLERVLRRARETASEADGASGASRRSTMVPTEVARHGLAIAEALECAHAEGVLHRDVKPSNVLLDTSGVVWITDFGLAKAEGNATLTRTGETVGTPRYMAPEAFSGWADPRTDVWGAGATLYEMLAGRPAFDGSDRAQLLKQIHSVEPVPLRRVDPAIPRDLATIVHKCLQKEPAARYATARRLAEDLRLFLAGEPILARPPSLAYRASLVVRRHRIASIATLGTLVVLVTLLAAWGASLDRKNVKLGEEKARAEANLQIASDSIEHLYHEVAATSLVREPTLDPIRRHVVEAALAFELKLLERQQGDPGKQLDVAVAHTRVAEIDWQLGRVEEGEAHCKEAFAILRTLLTEQPGSRPELLALSMATDVFAMLVRESGDVSGAAAACRENVDRLERLAAAKPDDFFALQLLLGAATHFCDVSTRDRRTAEGARVLRATLERVGPALAADPDRRTALSKLRNAWFWVSMAELAAIGPVPQRDCLERSLACADELLEFEDRTVQDQETDAFVRCWLAGCEISLGRLDEAASHIAVACADFERIAPIYGSNADYRCDLAAALGTSAQIELARDPAADVEPTLRRALAMAAEARADRSSPLLLTTELQLRSDLGTLLNARGDVAVAHAIFVASIESAEQALTDRSRWSTPLVESATVLWYDRAVTENSLGDCGAAEASVMRALELADWLLSGDGANFGARDLRAKSLTLLGGFLAGRGCVDEALARWRDAQEEARAVLRSGGVPIEQLARWSYFSKSITSCVRALNLDANVRARNGDRPGARERLDEAIGLARILADARPEDPAAAAALGTAHADRGQVADMDGDDARTHAEFMIALPLLGDAARRQPHDAPTRRALAIALDWFAASIARPDDATAPEGLDGFVATAIAAADAAPDDPMVQYGVARVLAHSAACKYGPVERMLGAPGRDPWADLAMERLRAASAAGYRNYEFAHQDDAFDSLQGREDFQRWCDELKPSSTR